MNKSVKGFPRTKKQRPSPAVLREMAKCRKVLGLPKRDAKG